MHSDLGGRLCRLEQPCTWDVYPQLYYSTSPLSGQTIRLYLEVNTRTTVYAHPSAFYHIEITFFEGQRWGGSCSFSSTADRFAKCSLGVTTLAAIEYNYLLPILMKNKQQGDKNPPSRGSSREAQLPRTKQRAPRSRGDPQPGYARDHI